MAIKETIISRVSTNKFKNEWVNPEKLIDLLETAVYAPNHKMRQPWRFIILEGEGKDRFVKNYISLFKEHDRETELNNVMKIMSAPVVVAFIMKKNPFFSDEIEDLQATAALIQNFLLLLEEQKMGSFWKTPKYIESDKFKDSLDLFYDELVVGLVMVGYPLVKMEPKQRKSARSLTTIY